MNIKVAWNGGKNAILTEKDRAFVDLILSGVGRQEALKQIYPKRYEGRTKKQINKSIQDILKKEKVKEYKESKEKSAEEAFAKAIEERAETIVSGLMSEEELMMHYSEIARSEFESTANRLKALDSLAKYRFGLDKKQVDLQADVSQQVIFLDDFDDGDDDEQYD